MKCKNCNGDLIFEKNIWTCSSCGSQFSLTEFCGDVDVFICYSEVDESGRRTKDSIIAQDIYHLLEQNKVKAFYKRISMEDVSENSAENMEEAALYKSKIVLLLGTSNQLFLDLWKKYGNLMGTKKIIPIYHGMDAKEIPSEINAIQALRYDQVGASSDLLSTVLRILGRQIEKEQSYDSLTQKQRSKKIMAVLIAAIIILIIAGAVIVKLIIGNSSTKDEKTENVLEVATQHGETSSSKEGEDELSNKEELYASGIECMDDGKYADAIDCFSKIGDYKDSNTKIGVCYAKYAGYYRDEKSEINFQMQMNGNKANISIQSDDNNRNICTIDENVTFDGNICSFTYLDSEGNGGKSIISLNNTGLAVSIETTDIKSNLYIPNADISFNITDKSDQPIKEGFSLDILKGFVSTKTTLGDLKRLGYDYQLEQIVMDYTGEGYYRIVNTDILVFAMDYDLNSYWENYDHWLYGDYKIDNTDDYIIYGIKAPAYIVAPEKIGDNTEPYIEDDYLFFPYCDYNVGGAINRMRSEEGVKEISSDTEICFCTTRLVEKDFYEALIQDFVTCKVQAIYEEEYDINGSMVEIISEEPEYYNVRVKDVRTDATGPEAFYKVYKEDYSVEKGGKVMTRQSDREYGNDSYIIPASSGRLLTEEDLIGLSNDQLRKARNEIVARHGRRFQDAELQAYFDSQPWYNGTIDPDDFNLQTMLSDIERDNMDFIMEHEK